MNWHNIKPKQPENQASLCCVPIGTLAEVLNITKVTVQEEEECCVCRAQDAVVVIVDTCAQGETIATWPTNLTIHTGL